MAEVLKAILESLDDSEYRQRVLARSVGDWVSEGLSRFGPRIADIVKAREGLGGHGKATLEELGKLQGVTRERIRQIEKKFWSSFKRPVKQPTLFSGTTTVTEHFSTAFVVAFMQRRGSMIVSLEPGDATFRFLARFARVPFVELPYQGMGVMVGLAADLLRGQEEPYVRDRYDPKIVSQIEEACSAYLSADDIERIARAMSLTRQKHLNKSDRVCLALKSIGRPAHYSEVCKVYNSIFPNDASSERVIHAALDREKNEIVWVGVKGTYALREWGHERPSMTLHETIARIVEDKYVATGAPVTTVTITAELGKYRKVVTPSSITFATHLNPRLRRIGADSFVPRDQDTEIEEGPNEADVDQVLRQFEKTKSTQPKTRVDERI